MFAAWITCDFVEQVNSSRLEFRHASNDNEQHGQKMGTGETALCFVDIEDEFKT